MLPQQKVKKKKKNKLPISKWYSFQIYTLWTLYQNQIGRQLFLLIVLLGDTEPSQGIAK